MLVASTPWLSMLLVALTLLIFVIDAWTPLDIAIAVMYVVVVLMSASVWQRRGVVRTALSCMGLTVLAFSMSHVQVFSSAALGRMLVSLAAIGITAYLALRGQGATLALLLREQALRRAQAQLAHVSRVTTLGELAASIAHEVNQPLAAVSANAEAALRWLDRPVPDLAEARAALLRIREASQRASDVIRRVRALARRGEPQQQTLDLREVVDEALLLLRAELQQHAVSVRWTAGPDLPPVRGDRVQLQQVVINLLMNAVQAMAAAAAQPALLELAASANADRSVAGDGEHGQAGVVFSVADSGPGIAEADLPRLFEAFYSTKPDGLGMGLPICRSIIENHGGRIWASSAPASGATLLLWLPAAAADAPP